MAKKKTASKKKAPARQSPAKKTASKKKVVKNKPVKKAAKAVAPRSAPKKVAKKTTKKKTAVRKPAAKKPVTKKSASKKPTAKKSASKKPASKKSPAKKSSAKPAGKPASQTASKASGKAKPSGNKAPSKKAPSKKPSAAKAMKPEPKAPPLAPQPVKKTSGRKPPAIVKSPIKKAPRKPFKSSRPAPSPKPKLNKPIVPAVQEPAAPDVPFDGPGLTDAELRKVKSGLGKRLLAKFRAQLLERRRELLGDLVGLEAAHKASSGDLSNMPVHMADVGSDAFDREFTLGLMESERHRIQQIDDALERIEAGTYGVCRMSGKPIEHARLEYVPWTRFCVEVARARERHGLK